MVIIVFYNKTSFGLSFDIAANEKVFAMAGYSFIIIVLLR
jgi:hypothetical protein